jgi:NADH:ubiquinone oxidoreductase subunit E
MATASAPFAALEPLLRRHHGRADALIEVLHGAQQCYGHLSDPLLCPVAARLQLPLSRVKGTASLYHLFRFQPLAAGAGAMSGLRCCASAGCLARGSGALMGALETAISRGELGDQIQLRPVGCLGPCSQGPLLALDPDGALYAGVEPHDAESLVAALWPGGGIRTATPLRRSPWIGPLPGASVWISASRFSSANGGSCWSTAA